MSVSRAEVNSGRLSERAGGGSTARYVYMHAKRQQQRGRNPSVPYKDERNPAKALELASAELQAQVEHSGATYTFEPPVEVGEHKTGSLAELVAIAYTTPGLPETARFIEMNSEFFEGCVRISGSNTHEWVAHNLNVVLDGRHMVGVVSADAARAA